MFLKGSLDSYFEFFASKENTIFEDHNPVGIRAVQTSQYLEPVLKM